VTSQKTLRSFRVVRSLTTQGDASDANQEGNEAIRGKFDSWGPTGFVIPFLRSKTAPDESEQLGPHVTETVRGTGGEGGGVMKVQKLL